jgi:hypothetical protein
MFAIIGNPYRYKYLYGFVESFLPLNLAAELSYAFACQLFFLKRLSQLLKRLRQYLSSAS